MNTIDIRGDELWFCHWRIGTRPAGMTATAWWELCGLIKESERDVDAEIDAAAQEIKEEVRAEIEGIYERPDGKLDQAFAAGMKEAGREPREIDTLKARFMRQK